MKIKNNIKKMKAFTLLELMVIMSVMTVLVAALSPAFTGKEKYSGDVVWHYIGGDRNGNAFSSPYNSYLRSAFYIGIAPEKEQIDNILTGDFSSFKYSNQLKLSKLILRPTDYYFGLRQHQDQIEFRLTTDYSNSTNREEGLHVASLFNDGENLLLGGWDPEPNPANKLRPYQNIQVRDRDSNSFGNTALGAGALTSITSDSGNTAIGSNTLTKMKDKHTNNTAIGAWNTNINIEGTMLSNTNRGRNTTIIGNINPNKTTTFQHDNTLISNNFSPTKAINIREKNTIIGANAAPYSSSAWPGAARTSSTGTENVIIGANAGRSLTTGSYNTIVGGGVYMPRGNDGAGDPADNTARDNIKTATNNAAGQYITTGSYNTIVGVNAGNAFAYDNGRGSNVTCIGYGSCPYLGPDSNNSPGGGGGFVMENSNYINSMGFFTEGDNAGSHVFIGGPPKAAQVPYTITNVGGNDVVSAGDLHSRGGFAVLEVHNVDHRNAKARILTDIDHPNETLSTYNNTGFGDETVLINGNLIVRGQTYLGGVPNRMHTQGHDAPYSHDGVDVNFPLFGMTHDVITDRNDNSTRAFMAYDGTAPNTNYALGLDEHVHSDIADNSSEYGFLEIYVARSKITDGHMHCTCAPNFKSYDWTSSILDEDGNPIGDNCNISAKNKKLAHSYFYAHRHTSDGRFTLDQEAIYNDMNMLSGTNCFYTDRYLNKNINYYFRDASVNPPEHWYSFNMAHGSGKTYDADLRRDVDAPDSCCPYINDISSDARLKNIGKKFTAGLAEIKKLKIFNFTMKADRARTPRVGVIAQDLAQIFPNAVSKDSSGFYRIRWDEMFYAAVNAIKEINSRVESLAQRVNKDVERVQNLKRENEQLTKQLEKLAQELDTLEKQKK